MLVNPWEKPLIIQTYNNKPKKKQQDQKRQHFFYLPCYQSLEGAYHEKH